jgi:hypothetical protein
MLTDSLDLAAFNTELGAYFRKFNPVIHRELKVGLFDGPLNLGDRWSMNLQEEDQDVLQSDIVTDFLRQFNPADNTGTFFPTAGAVKPDARILQVRDYKGDLVFLDNEVEKTFLMYREKAEMLMEAGTPATQVQSFVEVMFWDSIIPAAKATLRKVIYQGVYNPTAAYGWANIMDGLQQLIANEITAGTIVPVPMTSPTTTNIIELVESVFDTLGTAYQNADDLVVELAQPMYKLWIRADRFAAGRTWQYNSQEVTVDAFANAKVLMEPMWTGNNVFIARKSNKLIGLKTKDSPGAWETQRFERTTKMMLNGKLGVQLRSVNRDTGNNNVAYGA